MKTFSRSILNYFINNVKKIQKNLNFYNNLIFIMKNTIIYSYYF